MASLRLKLKVDIPKFREAVETYPAQMRAAFVEALDRGAEIVEREAKINLTQNRSVVFGALRASIGHKTNPETLQAVVGPGLFGRPGTGVGDPLNYGLFVEEGRAAGKSPPFPAIELWVQRKLGEGDPEEITRLAFLIARSIGRKGTTAAPFLEPAAVDNEARITVRMQGIIDSKVDELNAEGGGA